MRRFFRLTDVATLLSVALFAAPSVNRLCAQDHQPTNVDSAVVVQSSDVVHDSAPTIDFRALSVSTPVAVSRTAAAPLAASPNSLRSAVHTRESLAPLSVNAKNANLGQSQALMVVGGAAIIVGAIIGDDPGTVIMVGGAIIGLYGLYQYLQ
jgi:hypothetical protein